jgi:iron complex outermembrane receptor protein
MLKENSEALQVVVISGTRDSYKIDKPSQSLRLNAPLIETPQNIQIVTREVVKGSASDQA